MVANDEREGWEEGLRHMERLHEAMLLASAGSCGVIKVELNELERKLGITYEDARSRGLLTRS